MTSAPRVRDVRALMSLDARNFAFGHTTLALMPWRVFSGRITLTIVTQSCSSQRFGKPQGLRWTRAITRRGRCPGQRERWCDDAAIRVGVSCRRRQWRTSKKWVGSGVVRGRNAELGVGTAVGGGVLPSGGVYVA